MFYSARKESLTGVTIYPRLTRDIAVSYSSCHGAASDSPSRAVQTDYGNATSADQPVTL